MKKLNAKNLKVRSFFTGILALTCVLFSCKTLPEQNLTVVDPLDLLDSESTFYIAAPKSVDPELVNKLILNNTKGLSESEADQIVSRINKVYAGLIKTRNDTQVQASIDCSVPVKFVPKVLTKKNGWSAVSYKPENGNESYSLYSNEDLTISFPSENISCFGRNLEDMISTYDSIHYIPLEESIGKKYNQIDLSLYDYLKNAEDEIRFYANKPQSYLSMLTGANLDLKLVDVKGSFKVDPDYSNQYLLNMNFNFKSAAYAKAGKTLLMLAFGLTNSECENPSPNELYITNIQISKSQLYKLLIQ